MDRRGVRRAEAGIGLIELMIAMSLSAILVTVIYNTFFRTQRAASDVMGKVEGRQGARAAVQLMERDLRMAGSGWGRMPVHGVQSNATLTLRGLNAGYVSAGNDSVSALGGWSTATTLRSSMTSQTAAIPCVSTAGFAAGDLVVVTDNNKAHLFQVTAVTASPANLTCASTSPYNQGTRAAWLGGYASGSRVFQVGWVTYRYDSTSYLRPSLVRHEFGKSPMIVAYDVASFEVSYRMADGTTTRNPLNLPMIEQVVPLLRPRNASGKAAHADSVWAAVRPRTF